uniref:Ribosome recycling factor domain-containing protein n=1 Tax=Strombidium rassoulzadegani TaxID=1082188 RepID=A0A7S3CKV0_9SPIT|mmetsp:Transcript_14460/g.24688  ORF Transcript_14460/g.24688 Transcript_14460/m.24688 type:complete len:227 (+) Transcript_14460:150-830(+)
MTVQKPIAGVSIRHFAKKGGKKDGKPDKQQLEKDKIREEFAEVDTEDIKNQYQESLDEVLEDIEEKLAQIKSGRASNDIFDDLEVKAYGESQVFQDLCQTIVRSPSLLTVKVFDEGVKEEVVKTLNRCDMDIEVQMEGKDIRIKLGQGKKEQQEQTLKRLKELTEEGKKGLRNARHEVNDTIKKLMKIMPKDSVKQFEGELEKQLKESEKQLQELIQHKQTEVSKQ